MLSNNLYSKGLIGLFEFALESGNSRAKCCWQSFPLNLEGGFRIGLWDSFPRFGPHFSDRSKYSATLSVELETVTLYEPCEKNLSEIWEFLIQ